MYFFLSLSWDLPLHYFSVSALNFYILLYFLFRIITKETMFIKLVFYTLNNYVIRLQ